MTAAFQRFMRRIVLVLGNAGTGKGTQCTRMAEELGVKHLSAGQLLRTHVKPGSKLGKLMSAGGIVPGKVTLGLLEKAMARHTGIVLIDGFPRNPDNLEEFNNSKCVTELVKLFHYKAPEEVLMPRLLSRGRADDNEETVRNRFRGYVEDTVPICEQMGDRTIDIDADGAENEVWERTRKAMLPILEDFGRDYTEHVVHMRDGAKRGVKKMLHRDLDLTVTDSMGKVTKLKGKTAFLETIPAMPLSWPHETSFQIKDGEYVGMIHFTEAECKERFVFNESWVLIEYEFTWDAPPRVLVMPPLPAIEPHDNK